MITGMRLTAMVLAAALLTLTGCVPKQNNKPDNPKINDYPFLWMRKRTP